MKKIFLIVFVYNLIISASNAQHLKYDGTDKEPDLETAKTWWPDLTDFWTPVGWKFHRFRYNVFFDGTLYANPGLSLTAEKWRGQGIQIRTLPVRAGQQGQYEKLRSERHQIEDDQSVIQGWAESAAPVLWSEWFNDGMLFRQHIFAHTPGSKDLKTGLEPLFAWMRLSVKDTSSGLPVPEKYTFTLQLNAVCISTTMNTRRNIAVNPKHSYYPRILSAGKYTAQEGLRIVEPDGKIRLAAAPGSKIDVKFLPGDSVKGKDPMLCITMDAIPGQYADVLIPMLPTEPDILNKELALGYDKALAESNVYWSKRPETAASIDVPETSVNETIKNFEQFAQVISEKDPETGGSIPLSGSLAYVKVWAAATAKTISMFLDPLGYHELARQYLEPFIAAQGTRKPPSLFLEKHPGYLGSPEKFKSFDWMADHGSLLFAIANHALMINDKNAKQRYVEPVVKACEFIQYARKVQMHNGIKGILPPARYSDAYQHTQGVWSDGWNYKGLITACRFLKQMNHPRAHEFEKEAIDYKKTFVAAFRAAAAKTRTWTDKQGKIHHLIPTSLYGSQNEALWHPFYLDTGPLQLVFAGLMEADDPLMQDALEWFRRGPIPVRLGRHNSNFRQSSFLIHEMSSCIPGYSWNLFHSHQSGDRQHFLEGMYSQYAGAVSRQTYTVCETRGGRTGRITHADLPFYMTRLAVLDDLIKDDELHLLRLCPLVWISEKKQTKFENMPTEFGPVTLKWQLSDNREILNLNYSEKFHTHPEKIYLHIPPIKELRYISINGKIRLVKPKDIILI